LKGSEIEKEDLNNQNSIEKYKKEVEMTNKRKQDTNTTLLFSGLVLMGMGGFFLFLYYVRKINISFGDVLINTELTGIFLGIVGILSLVLYLLHIPS